ncbi:MAG TPA: PAS domain S-box protein, partial [Paludibacter sp.]
MNDQNKTKEELIKELQELKKDYNSLKALYDKDITEHKEIEDAMRKSQENYSSLYQNAHVGIYRTKIDGSKILEINNTTCEMLGFSKEEMLSQPYAIRWAEPNRRNEILKILKEHGVANNFDADILKKDGSKISCLLSMMIYKDEGYIEGFIVNINERKRAEDAVRQSRKELDLLFEASPEMISFIGFDGYFKRLNPAWAKTLGYPMDKLLSIPFIEFVHPDDHEATNAEVAKLAEGQRTIRFDNRYRCNDGSYRWLSWSVIPDTKEKLLYAVARDITKRKQAEEKLKESEEKYRLIVENIGEGFGFTDPEEKFVIANKSADDILGVEPGELVGMNLNQFVSDDQYKLVFEETALREKGIKSVYELEIIRPNGEKRTISVTSVPKNDKDGIFIGTYALFSDITERKQAEGKALKNQYYLTKAQEIGVIGTWELDIQKDILRWTDENYKIFGVPIGTEMNLGLLFNCIHPDDRDYVNEKWSAALNNEPYDIEHRLLVRDKVKWVREKADIEFDTLGNPIIAIGFAQDITDRKLAEEKLKESEEKFRTLFQNHSTIKLLIDPDNSNIIDANRAAAVFYGWSVEKLKTMNISEINTLSPDEIKKVMNLAKNNVKNNFELKHRKADGSIWDVSIDSGIITINGKRYLYAIVRNITEHKKLEEERKQALEKLRTFATMLQINREEERKSIAREIHDEFGQVLTAIKMNLTMLGKETTKTVESSTATSILSEIDN